MNAVNVLIKNPLTSEAREIRRPPTTTIAEVLEAAPTLVPSLAPRSTGDARVAVFVTADGDAKTLEPSLTLQELVNRELLEAIDEAEVVVRIDVVPDDTAAWGSDG